MTSSEQAPPKPTLRLYYQDDEDSYEEDVGGHDLRTPTSDLEVFQSHSMPATDFETFLDQVNAPPVPVSCGNITGKLYLQHFICPGIHQPCIEYRGVLVTPKEFCIKGCKEKQKDWKGSIKIGKSSLRSHMEALTIDFYDHGKRCSGKCQSRNYVGINNAVREQLGAPKPTRQTRRKSAPERLHEDLLYQIHTQGHDLQLSPSTRNNEANIGQDEPEADQLVEQPKKPRGRPRGSGKNQKLKAAADAEAARLAANGCSNYTQILSCLQNDPTSFWGQMQRAGVISHFCDDVIVSAMQLKEAIAAGNFTAPVSTMLTRAVFAFDIQNTVVERVQAIEAAEGRYTGVIEAGHPVPEALTAGDGFQTAVNNVIPILENREFGEDTVEANIFEEFDVSKEDDDVFLEDGEIVDVEELEQNTPAVVINKKDKSQKK